MIGHTNSENGFVSIDVNNDLLPIYKDMESTSVHRAMSDLSSCYICVHVYGYSHRDSANLPNKNSSITLETDTAGGTVSHPNLHRNLGLTAAAQHANSMDTE